MFLFFNTFHAKPTKKELAIYLKRKLEMTGSRREKGPIHLYDFKAHLVQGCFFLTSVITLK